MLQRAESRRRCRPRSGLQLALLSLLALASVECRTQESDPDWSVKFFVGARSDFDRWTQQPRAKRRQWMRQHYERMLTYSPYFDTRLTWFPNAWVYKDSYAIYEDSPLVTQHPEWILRDEHGDALYIPYGCSRGRCPQYAADFGSPEFRRHWIENLRQTLAKGYLGVYVDDVNLDWRVSDGSGDHVKPIDPRTGQQMTLANWRRYFAEFMELIREEFPTIEIIHNSIWYATPADDPSILRQISAADYIGIERGATDDGITGGSGKYGFETFLAFIDKVHELGGSIILDDDDSDTLIERDYELATYFLITRGRDLIGADGDRDRMNPGNFWHGYELDLGEPVTDRQTTEQGLLTRDFQCGRILLNQPEQPSRRVRIDPEFITIDAQREASATLRSSSALILIRESCDVF